MEKGTPVVGWREHHRLSGQPAKTRTQRSRDKKRALRCAIYYQFSEPRNLLNHAVDIVVQNGWGIISWRHDFTALHLAARQGCVESVRLLLSLGATASLALRDNFKRRPVDYALARQQVDLELLELLSPAEIRLDLLEPSERGLQKLEEEEEEELPAAPQPPIGGAAQTESLPTLLTPTASDGKRWGLVKDGKHQGSVQDDRPMGFAGRAADPAAAAAHEEHLQHTNMEAAEMPALGHQLPAAAAAAAADAAAARSHAPRKKQVTFRVPSPLEDAVL